MSTNTPEIEHSACQIVDTLSSFFLHLPANELHCIRHSLAVDRRLSPDARLRRVECCQRQPVC